MERYTQEYTGATQRLHTSTAPLARTQRRVDFTMLLIASAAVLLLIVLLARLPEPTSATSTPVGGNSTITSSFNDQSWHWDFCAGYCPR